VLPAPIKNAIKAVFRFAGIDLTRNMKYDRLTSEVLRRTLRPDSSCIDVGAHQGEILREFLRLAPEGRHHAFEPIPALHASLQHQFGHQAVIHDCALSTASGRATFNVVPDDPAYSGLQKRKYRSPDTRTETIQVEVRTLDELFPPGSPKTDLIKIDVEGGEYDVLRGGGELLRRDHPLIIFECGLGASDYYGTEPAQLFRFLRECGYVLRSLPGFVSGSTPLDEETFCRIYEHSTDYYFVASV
jgi:FkbM family methyltransferase